MERKRKLVLFFTFLLNIILTFLLVTEYAFAANMPNTSDQLNICGYASCIQHTDGVMFKKK